MNEEELKDLFQPIENEEELDSVPDKYDLD